MGDSHTILAVLAGGEARRMGGGKAGALLAGRPLISYPLAAARQAGLETVVVAKRATVLPALKETVLIEPDQPTHPLCGILAALDFALTRPLAPDVLFVACDMPFLTGELLQAMAGLGGTAMTEAGRRPQPLPARLEARHRAALKGSLDAQGSLRAALEALEPHVVSEVELSLFGVPERLCFSVNSPAEMAEAERVLTGA